MKTRHFLTLASLVLVLISCGETQKEESEKHKNHSEIDHSKDKNQHSNESNEHMHQRSVEELINNFESPERDAYQQP